MEVSRLDGCINSKLYPGFYDDVIKYFEYLKIIHSNKVKDVLVGTNEFKTVEIPNISDGSFHFKMEVPRIRSFDEVIQN